MICPGHNHSEYSYLDGFSTVDEIADRAVEIGAEACGLTDHGVVAGHLDFAKALQKRDVKPIFGCELYHGTKREGFQGRERDQAHLIAFAMTDRGLRNLWSLTDLSSRYENFHNVGRVFAEELEKHKEGIVFTSACALGLVPKGILRGDYTWANWYLETFRDNFRIELSTYPPDKDFDDRDSDEPINTRIINEALVEWAQERGVGITYGDDGHYAFPWQAECHDVYLALQTGQSIYTPIEDRTMWHPPGAVCMKDEKDVRKALSYLPERIVDEAIANACALGQQAVAKLPEVRRHLPVFVPSDCPFLDEKLASLSPDELFIELVIDGIHKRYGEDPSAEVWERVAQECETLINDGIHHYFLWGWDEVTYCDVDEIPRGPGRGSSAGCIVAYALGITDVDPLHYDLIFERFWNSGRASGFPDIDTDFSQEGRQRVISYLRDRLGHDKVMAIGTVGRMKPKAVIDKLSRGIGITLQEAEELKSIVGKTHDIEIHGVDQIGWSKEREPGKVIYVEEDCGEEIEKWIAAERNRVTIRTRLVDMCKVFCSRVQLYGVHPSGVVISDVKTRDELPAYRRGGKEKGVPATQFPMDDVDSRYFVKLDVLGLRTLDTLEHWRLMMRDDRGIDINWSGLDKEDHPDEMWQLLHEGFTAGIFQIETNVGKRLCGQMNPSSMDDLIVINAINRPGPNVDKYLAKRNGEEPVTYAHPRLEELLSPVLALTYGEFVFQEQVINYFKALGYDLGEADAVRKILGKKKPEALAALHDGSGDWKGRGYLEMAAVVGVPQGPAQSVWDGLERFASYSFNKSHAAAYGIIGFRCLFAKYYGPAQFYAACVRTAEGDKRHEMIGQYVNEARRMGLDAHRPDIEMSQGLCTVDEGDDIWFGFGDVKGVGESGNYMAELRDRIDHSTPELFYDRFEELNKAYLKRKQQAKKALVRNDLQTYTDLMFEFDPKSPKQKLGSQKIEAVYKAGAWDNLVEPQISMAERQALEQELLGVILTDSTKEALEANAEEIAGCDDWDDVVLAYASKVELMSLQEEVPEDFTFRYEVCGIVTSTQEKRGKKSGKSFGIVTIEYGRHELEFVAFHNAWKANKFLFRIRTPGIFTIKHGPPSEYGESYQFMEGRILRP